MISKFTKLTFFVKIHIMNRFDIIEKILDELLQRGSTIDYIKELKEKSLDIVSKDRSLSEVLNDIALDIENITRMFLDAENEYSTKYISGISTGIYLPDYSGLGSYKYVLIGGDKKRGEDSPIDFDTLFDVASITKLYTLVLLFKLEELGLIDLNTKVKDLNPDIQGLEDFTLNDLVRLHGELRTNGNVATASSYEEAYERLKSVYLVSNDRTKNTYTDFGALVISDTIEKVISKVFGKDMKFDEIMNEFLFKPLYIKNTTFTPGVINITGNATLDGLPHDPKSRALNGVTGHAGIFTNSEDLTHLADGVFDGEYLSGEHVRRLGERTFEGSPKGNLGLYIKNGNGWADTYTGPEFSDGSFSHQGWTGVTATFDPNNKIHNSILANAIYESEDKEQVKNNKPVGYSKQFGLYQCEITKRIMLMYVAKKYFNKYCNIREDINVTKMI